MDIDCNNCGYVSLTEEEQTDNKRPHVCNCYNKRVFHSTLGKPMHKGHYRLFPCYECKQDSNKNFTPRNSEPKFEAFTIIREEDLLDVDVTKFAKQKEVDTLLDVLRRSNNLDMKFSDIEHAFDMYDKDVLIRAVTLFIFERKAAKKRFLEDMERKNRPANNNTNNQVDN